MGLTIEEGILRYGLEFLYAHLQIKEGAAVGYATTEKNTVGTEHAWS